MPSSILARPRLREGNVPREGLLQRLWIAPAPRVRPTRMLDFRPVRLRDAAAGGRSRRPCTGLPGRDWRHARQGLAARSRWCALLIAASILVVISLAGNRLLRQLAIGLPAFQIAGGLLLFGVSYQMIFGDRPHREAREADKATSQHASDVAVFPLAIPMMAGPGAIPRPRCC